MLVPVVVLLVLSALTLAGLNTLDVHFVPLTAPDRPARVPTEPRCWKVVEESDDSGKLRGHTRPPPRPRTYFLVPEGQGRVMPCDADD